MPTNPELSLENLVKSLQLMSAQESHYRHLRTECEMRIADMLPGADEGTTTAEVDGLKVRVVRKFNRTLDEKAYRENMYLIPSAINPIVMKPTIDLKVLRAIEIANPEAFKVCQKFISVKPAKASVSVEEMREADNG